MTDIFKRRCSCGAILSARQSCVTCAARKRSELHAAGVATTRCQEACKHIEWNLATNRCAACGASALLAYELKMQAECTHERIDSGFATVRTGHGADEISVSVPAVTCVRCGLHGERLTKARGERGTAVPAPAMFQEPPVSDLAKQLERRWSGRYMPRDIIECDCGMKVDVTHTQWRPVAMAPHAITCSFWCVRCAKQREFMRSHPVRL